MYTELMSTTVQKTLMLWYVLVVNGEIWNFIFCYEGT